MKKCISYIIPAYNAEKTIAKCIESLLKSPFCQEVIVVDDGSTDNTKSQCDKFSDQRIHYIYQENKGVSSARNTGIKYAKGRYIGFSDADDEVHIDAIDNICDALKENPDMIMADYTEINDTQQNNITLDCEQGIKDKDFTHTLTQYMLNYPISKKGTRKYMGGKIFQYFYKSDFIKDNKIAFDTNLKFAEDLCFLIKCFRLCKSIYYTPVSIYRYYVIQGSASHRFRIEFWNELKSTYSVIIKNVDENIDVRGIYYYYAKMAILNYAYATNCLSWNERKKNVEYIISDRNIYIDIDSMKNLTFSENMLLNLMQHKATSIIIILLNVKRKFKQMLVWL